MPPDHYNDYPNIMNTESYLKLREAVLRGDKTLPELIQEEDDIEERTMMTQNRASEQRSRDLDTYLANSQQRRKTGMPMETGLNPLRRVMEGTY